MNTGKKNFDRDRIEQLNEYMLELDEAKEIFDENGSDDYAKADMDYLRAIVMARCISL